MFTDMVGFTALTQSSESVAMEVLEKHNKLLRPFFPKFNGREVKAIGDSFLVEFDSALDALRCAVEIQSFLREYNSSTSAESKITLRIGVHLGDVIHRDGDVFGDAVNISSRIEPLAEPGGVCISRQVYDQVHNKFDLPFVSIGEKGLKNVKYPTEVYSVQMPWNQMLKADSPDAKRVAVLPFSNMSPDPADEYFADGMTEELISTVSRIEGTEVISRTSVMQYKKSPKPIREISRELEAGTVLEGSVRKAGNRLRVTVQMIDAGKDRHLWAESYDRNLDDVFAIQSDIAGRVATALKTRFASGTPDPASATRNLEAYTLFLRGSQLYHEDTVQSLKEAISCLEEAVRMDPGFSRSYSMLALALRSQAGDSGDYDAFMAKAEAAARRALELEPNGADAHVAMGAVHIGLDRFEDGRREMEAAIRINPNLSGAFLLLGEERGTIGAFDESISYFEKARTLDPISFHPVNELAHTLRVAGRVGESIELLRGAKQTHEGRRHRRKKCPGHDSCILGGLRRSLRRVNVAGGAPCVAVLDQVGPHDKAPER